MVSITPTIFYSILSDLYWISVFHIANGKSDALPIHNNDSQNDNFYQDVDTSENYR